MGIKLHANAASTPRIRTYIQQSTNRVQLPTEYGEKAMCASLHASVVLVAMTITSVLGAADEDLLLYCAYDGTDHEQLVRLGLDLARLRVKPGLKGRDAFPPHRTYTLAKEWEDRLPPREFRLIVWPASEKENRRAH